jgi:hypothetical protein
MFLWASLASALLGSGDVALTVAVGSPCVEERRLKSLLEARGAQLVDARHRRDALVVDVRAVGERLVVKATRRGLQLERSVPVERDDCAAVERVLATLIESWSAGPPVEAHVRAPPSPVPAGVVTPAAFADAAAGRREVEADAGRTKFPRPAGKTVEPQRSPVSAGGRGPGLRALPSLERSANTSGVAVTAQDERSREDGGGEAQFPRGRAGGDARTTTGAAPSTVAGDESRLQQAQGDGGTAVPAGAAQDERSIEAGDESRLQQAQGDGGAAVPAGAAPGAPSTVAGDEPYPRARGDGGGPVALVGPGAGVDGGVPLRLTASDVSGEAAPELRSGTGSPPAPPPPMVEATPGPVERDGGVAPLAAAASPVTRFKLELAALGGTSVGPTSAATGAGQAVVGVSLGRWGLLIDAGLESARQGTVAPVTVEAATQWATLSARVSFTPLPPLSLDVALGLRGWRIVAQSEGAEGPVAATLFGLGPALSGGASWRLIGPLHLHGRASLSLRTPIERFNVEGVGTVLTLRPWAFEGLLGLLLTLG